MVFIGNGKNYMFRPMAAIIRIWQLCLTIFFSLHTNLSKYFSLYLLLSPSLSSPLSTPFLSPITLLLSHSISPSFLEAFTSHLLWITSARFISFRRCRRPWSSICRACRWCSWQHCWWQWLCRHVVFLSSLAGMAAVSDWTDTVMRSTTAETKRTSRATAPVNILTFQICGRKKGGDRKESNDVNNSSGEHNSKHPSPVT